VHVEIHDRRTADRRLALQNADCDREVVEVAKALAAIGERMVESTSQVDAGA